MKSHISLDLLGQLRLPFSHLYVRVQLLFTLYKVKSFHRYLYEPVCTLNCCTIISLFLIIRLFLESFTGMDRTTGQRENLRWRKDLTQWRQTNDRQDKWVVAVFCSFFFLLSHHRCFFYLFVFLLSHHLNLSSKFYQDKSRVGPGGFDQWKSCHWK